MSTHLTPLLHWCLDRVRAHIGRHGLRLTHAGRQLGDLYVGIDEVKRVLDGQGTFDLAAELGLEPGPAPGPPPRPAGSPLARVADRFELDPTETALLAAAAGPALAVDVARLYRFAWADAATRLPSVAFLTELVTDSAAAAVAAAAYLRPDGRLRRAGLLRLEPEPSRGGPRAPFVHHGALVPDPVLALLRGEPPLALGRATLRPPIPQPQAFDPSPAVVERLVTLLRAGVPRVVLIGPRGAGRREAVRVVCGRRRVALLEIDLEALPTAEAPFTGALVDLLLDARLHGLPVLLLADGALHDDARVAAVERAIGGHRGLVVVAAHRPHGAGLPDFGDAALVDVPRPDGAAQRALWIRELGDEDLAEQLVGRFDVTPGTLLRAVDHARRATPGAPLDAATVSRALRRQVQHALDGLSEPVHTTLDWQDVVLPGDVVERLHEIRAHARHRARVFDSWGFRRKMAYGRGLSCLFSGPPGTGKTMMAGIIANDLGRELYKVDLSRVVSKWVGETEKNLGRIFDEAEQAQVILFFDEADSLFSARTEVKGANDRFANMEVNYLLQRMEQYDGVSILTTNFERGLDEAFRRRLKFRVHFPLPDTGQRIELWRRMIPPEMPVDDEIDFERLGRKHKMSGGNIKNAVLRAAFYAAEEGGGLTTARLSRAAEAESREMGRL